MKEEICEFCYEKNCICYFVNCSICGKKLPEGQMYEYRGFKSCGDCFDILHEKVDNKRKEVMEITEHSIKSQRNGEFVNNKNSKIGFDGLPIIKIREPQILKDYENGIL